MVHIQPERNILIPLAVLTVSTILISTLSLQLSIRTEHVFIPLASGPYGIYNIQPNPQPLVKEVY